MNRRGRLVDCTVRITRLVANEEVRGVILLMDAVVQQEDGRRDVTQAVQPRD